MTKNWTTQSTRFHEHPEQHNQNLFSGRGLGGYKEVDKGGHNLGPILYNHEWKQRICLTFRLGYNTIFRRSSFYFLHGMVFLYFFSGNNSSQHFSKVLEFLRFMRIHTS